MPEEVRSPGWRSDLGLHAALGSLSEIDEGWRCELPSVPDNPFGNLLLLKGAPEAYTPAQVTSAFDRCFAGSGVPQLCVGFDDPTTASSLAPFVAQGFDAIDDVALAFEGPELADSPSNTGLSLCRLDLEQDRARVLDCELAVDGARQQPYGRQALERNLAWSHAVITSAGPVGSWYGAELEGMLVATLGIVSVGGEGRLQSVGTRPSQRNRGIGRSLLAWAWRDAAARFQLERLLLVTARDGDAERFYRRLGFARIGRSLGVLRAR